jgi:endonuclease YncB( thermonuclease family)
MGPAILAGSSHLPGLDRGASRQKLRLRGIDCPEMDSPGRVLKNSPGSTGAKGRECTEEGKKAADFVRARIRVASEIILTSSKSD